MVRAVSAADGSDPRLSQDEPASEVPLRLARPGDGPAGPGLGPGRADLPADGVILAVPSYAAPRLVPAAQAAAAARWAGLGTSPIVNVHVIYDRQVTGLPYAAAVGSPVQWVFDKTRQAGLPSGQYLAVSLSAADEYVDVPAARLRAAFLPALEELFPAAARGPDHRLLRDQGAAGHVPAGAGLHRAAAGRRHLGARFRAGRRLDGHRLARHHGGRGAQRAERGTGDQLPAFRPRRVCPTVFYSSGLDTRGLDTRGLNTMGPVTAGPAADDAGPGLPGPAAPPGPAAVASADTPAGAAS